MPRAMLVKMFSHPSTHANLSRVTRPDRPLLETPMNEWTYDLVDQFLSARIREDERIEYKAQFQTKDDNFLDTLVAMANADGCFIFVGVSEHDCQPIKWPLLEPG